MSAPEFSLPEGTYYGAQTVEISCATPDATIRYATSGALDASFGSGGNVTTNVEFGRWVTIFLDRAMTTALIDRLVHHSHLLIFDGESHRVKKSLMRQ